MVKKSFVLYHDQRKLFEALTDEQGMCLLNNVFDYSESRKENCINDPVVNMAFISIKTTLDRDYERYLDIIKKRQESGRKGGRPKKSK